MEIVWERGACSVRDVMDSLNRGVTSPRAYTTYLTIMSRLDGKGFTERERVVKTDIYRPAISRDEYRAARAGAEVAALVDQYGDAALSHFARQVAQLDPERRRDLERLGRGE